MVCSKEVMGQYSSLCLSPCLRLSLTYHRSFDSKKNKESYIFIKKSCCHFSSMYIHSLWLHKTFFGVIDMGFTVSFWETSFIYWYECQCILLGDTIHLLISVLPYLFGRYHLFIISVRYFTYTLTLIPFSYGIDLIYKDLNSMKYFYEKDKHVSRK